MLQDVLNPQKARIFRIVHRDNVPWILRHGLHCKTAKVIDPNFVPIGNADLIDRRSRHPVPHPPYGTLADYVPFYFTPFSPMFYNIHTGWNGIRKRANEEIVILVSSLHKLIERGVTFMFTDRHAVLAAARHFTRLQDLDQIDWVPLQNRDFKKDPEDPRKVERYEAETLVHKHIPCDALLGIVCYNDAVLATLSAEIQKRQMELPVAKRPMWYF